jgi:hypothetical protein
LDQGPAPRLHHSCERGRGLTWHETLGYEFRSTFTISVTNAAGPGNDLLMMVSDEELLVASVGDEEAFAAFYRRHARPLAGFSCGAPATPSWRPI